MEFDDYQQIITEYLEKYQQSPGKAIQLRKKAKQHIDEYQIQLEDNYASAQRFKWLENAKLRLQSAQSDKKLVVNKNDAKKLIKQVGEEVDDKQNQIHKNIEEAIKVSTYIRVELDRQIQELDGLYEENKDTKKRIKKAQKGLRVIIRKAMLTRCTRFLCVLTVLGVIAVIVVYILKGNGVI